MKKLKAAIVGMGNIAPMHIKSLEAIGVEVAAVCDIKLVPPAFADYKEMLDAGGFDVLHVCLPHHLHAEVSIAALERGVHVLCEKPMATTVSDAEAMLAAAKKSGAKLSVVFQNRHNPGAQLIKSVLQSGELGAVKSGWLRVTWCRDESYYATSTWRGKWATEGGGVLINQSIHAFDMANYFLGNPTAVDANIANRAHPSIEVEDVAEGIIYYGDIVISFFVNTYHPYDAPAGIELICENGSAKLIGEDATVTYANGQEKTAGADMEAQRQFGMKSYWGVSHVKHIKAFYETLETEQNCSGLQTQKLINGIYDSAKSRSKILFA
ncbi:MAG: Gfo/Idh/MocA family oxidoreductase [Defluviitaleaceae bacterium]|nr:Gfo/Idh/MocA family oxidoreductase [Defluviitaleaceae bacterium]